MLTLTLILADVKVSGVSYIRYTITADSSLNNGFYIDRAYANLISELLKSENLTLKFRYTLDVGQIRDVGKSGSYKLNPDSTIKIPNSAVVGSYFVYSKYAFLETNYKNFKIYFGQTYNFWIKQMEDIWVYRFIEKTPTDYFSILSSADFGIAFEYNSKLVNVNLGVFNGEGYNKVEDNKFKDLELTISAYPYISDNLKIGLFGYGHYGKYRNENEKIRLNSALAIIQKFFTLSFEYSNFKGSTLTSQDTISSNLISGLISVKPNQIFDIIFRFDRYEDRNFIIGGFVLNLSKNLRGSVNYKQDKDDKFVNVQTEIKF
ncbi:MAG: hypothetical protein ABIL76_00260 [candidate division WOR-3 bacterium]